MRVLIKETQLNESLENAFQTAFPGASRSDFYYEVLNTTNKTFVAICKKMEVNSIINRLGDSKINLHGFRIGLFSIVPLLPLIGEESLNLNGREIIVSDNNFHEINKVPLAESEYSLNGMIVSSKYIIALSGLLNYEDESYLATSNQGETIAGLRKLYKEKTFFRKFGLFAIGFLLVVLLVNFVLFSIYRSEVSELRTETELYSSQKETYENKLSSVETKEQVVRNLLQSGNSKSSFYVNRIVTSKPASISFSQINYQPLIRSIRPDKEIEVRRSSISVAGESLDKQEFSNWMKRLESFDWSSEIVTSEYGESNNKDRFELTIKIEESATAK